MLIKLTFILALVNSSVHASDIMNTDAFDPQTSQFSHMATLENWVAEKYHHHADTMKEIQRNVAMEVPQNIFSFNFLKPILNNEGDTRYFGKNYFALHAIQLPFLEAIHQISLHKNPIILEIGAAFGLVSWKIPYALENMGNIYVNELSGKMIEMLEAVLTNRLSGDMRELIKIIPGDCFDILDTYSELIGNVDAIYVQNLEHFFNPEQHQKFMALIELLLIPGGKAFLTANTLNPDHIKKGHPVYETYIKEKTKGAMYPGFMTCVGDVRIDLESGAQLGEIEVVRAWRPDDTILCSTEKPENSHSELIEIEGMGIRKIESGCQRVTHNSFTPTIYKNAIAPHKNLTVLESFFMNMVGDRFEKYNDAVMHFASAIVEKKVD